MNELQVAIYARVSSEQQSEANTIESQLSELRARVKALGLMLPTEHEFVDNGYSGSTLIRPALEQLRDVVAAGGIDRLYVHCPDRLARNYGGLCSNGTKNGSGAKLVVSPSITITFSQVVPIQHKCLFMDGQATQRTRVRSRSKFARQYMLRLINLSRLTFPSTGPWLHFKLNPALTAASSRCNAFAKLINSSIPLF
jgi:Resolvase, N terminal domain